MSISNERRTFLELKILKMWGMTRPLMSGSCYSCYQLYLYVLGSKVITRGSIELTQVWKWEMAHNEWETIFGIQIGSEVVFTSVSAQTAKVIGNPV